MNYCKHCGAALKEEARFCGGCGEPVEATMPHESMKESTYETSPYAPQEVSAYGQPYGARVKQKNQGILLALAALLLIQLVVVALFGWPGVLL